MRGTSGLRTLALAACAVAVVLVSCKRRDEGPPPNSGYYPPPQGGYYPPPQGGYYPPPQGGYYPPPQGGYYPPPQGPAPAPAGVAAPLTPAFGFNCVQDSDMQCLYGRCVNGRCGGCADASWCKQGSSCVASPLGGTCWAGFAPPQPGPRPAPGPQPNMPPATPPPFQPPPPVAPLPPPNPNDPFAQARQSCVDRINAYRARVRAAPVARDPAGEPCADEESRLDARSNRAHGSFGRCGERAQNACPNYPGKSTEEVLAKCLEQMFDEGPGGGHYDNMTNTKYTKAFCGFESLGGGRIWTVQNFR